MSGHAWSAFFGVSEFLRWNPDLAADVRTAYSPRLVANGGSFPGQRGGSWRKKLPPRQGGTQQKGGAGSGLVARLFILLDRYGDQVGY
jgi:hypothetical protein